MAANAVGAACKNTTEPGQRSGERDEACEEVHRDVHASRLHTSTDHRDDRIREERPSPAELVRGPDARQRAEEAASLEEATDGADEIGRIGEQSTPGTSADRAWLRLEPDYRRLHDVPTISLLVDAVLEMLVVAGTRVGSRTASPRRIRLSYPSFHAP